MVPERIGFVGAERWHRAADTPATALVWAERLGQPAGMLAVCGAVNRGWLVDDGRGVLRLTAPGRAELRPASVARPMAQMTLPLTAEAAAASAPDRPAAPPLTSPAGHSPVEAERWTR